MQAGKPAPQVVFVSNASRPPAALLADQLAAVGATSAHGVILAEAVRRVDAAYAAGDAVCTYPRLRELVETVAAETGRRPTRDDVRTIATWLYHPYCDAAYRQQAMRWAADACEALGLSFGLYGAGWEKHLELSKYARGPVQNGPPLHALTRAAVINLQVVPYLCLHQRLLDGLSAGGFFLVREHLADVAPQAMADLLTDHGAAGASSVPEAQALLAHAGPAVRRRFDALADACRACMCGSGDEDPVEYVWAWRDNGFLVPGAGVLPHLADVSFADAAGLLERLRRFVNDPAARSAVAAEQRRPVADRLTYDAGLKRVVDTVAARLAGTDRTISFRPTPGGKAA